MTKKTTPESAAAEWIELEAQSKAIKERFEELEEILKPELKSAPENTLRFDGWDFVLVTVTDKESFRLSAAKEKIDGRTLAPFITKSTFSYIRPVWQGGDELEAREAA